MFDLQVSTEGTIFTTHLMVKGNPWMLMRKSLSPLMMGPLNWSDLQIVRMLGKSSSGHKHFIRSNLWFISTTDIYNVYVYANVLTSSQNPVWSKWTKAL